LTGRRLGEEVLYSRRQSALALDIRNEHMKIDGLTLLLVISVVATAKATPWEDYLKRPTPELASLVLAPTYSKDAGNERREKGLLILESRILAGEPNAVRLAFRIRSKLDGALAEGLDISLGRLIRIDAKMFLRELTRAGVEQQRLDSLVGNLGPEFVDRTEAQALERTQRIKALRGVKDSHLKEARERCIMALKQQLDA
jgi:hypothetical protein